MPIVPAPDANSLIFAGQGPNGPFYYDDGRGPYGRGGGTQSLMQIMMLSSLLGGGRKKKKGKTRVVVVKVPQGGTVDMQTVKG